MPVSQLIIGIDLASIKPIPNVITMINDITTEKCRTDLKRELKSWKADVFLNDGAPNVGSAWAHDAFTQAELVLSALKLATEFLTEGGTFVTKIFRSKDYNSLLWVFKQLFKTVEATKPASSRSVSAEIFVVCRGFLAPSSIDPRFLDPKHVFEELPGKPGQAAGGQSVNILQPEKKQRHRDGYEDGQMVIHKTLPVLEFIQARDPVGVLSTTNRLAFGPQEAEQLQANADILVYCEDLKVLGRKDFKALLKWRTQQRAKLAPAEPKEDEEQVIGEAEKVAAAPEDPLKELDDLAGLAQRMVKREKRKELEKKAKQRLRLQLQMEHGGDLADDQQEEGLFNIRALKRKAKLAAILSAQPDNESGSDAEAQYGPMESGSEAEKEDSTYEDSADEAARWDEEMEEQYQRFQSERLQKDALRFVKARHEDSAEAEEQEERLAGRITANLEDEAIDTMSELSDSGSEAEGELNVDIRTPGEKEAQQSARADLFYSNPIFNVLSKLPRTTRAINRDAKRKEAQSDSEEVEDLLPKSKKQRAKILKLQQKEDKDAKKDAAKGIVFVKADPRFDEPEDNDAQLEAAPVHDDRQIKRRLLTDPRTMSLATQLVSDRRRNKDDLVDKSFNRFAFGDGKSLPSWFRADEDRHNKPQEPLSKEAAALIKERMRKLEAQPNSKVLEAKGRNKMRVMKRLEVLKRKATVIADSEEIGGRQKSEQIDKMMRSARKPTKKEKKVVVAKGKLRGVKGRPRGVKGHYKMVDRRAKKDTRASKAQQKKSKR